MLRPRFLAALVAVILLAFLVSPGLALTVVLLFGVSTLVQRSEARRSKGG
jgi:hypothetical protein